MDGRRFEQRSTGQAGEAQDISTSQEAAIPRVVEPEIPAPSEPPPGTRPNNAGKVAAGISACILLIGAVWLTVAIVRVRDQAFVQIESVVESVDATDGCRWLLDIELRNTSEEAVRVRRIAAVLNQGMNGGTMDVTPPLEPEEIGTYRVSFRLPAEDPCIAVDEINHGNIIFHLADGSSESVRF